MRESLKNQILDKLKDHGCRITKQRILLLEIILKEDCTSCKELYFKAKQNHLDFGLATIYRFVNTLEEIGALKRKNIQTIIPNSYGVPFYEVLKESKSVENKVLNSSTIALNHQEFTVVLEDKTTYQLTEAEWKKVLAAGLSACGFPMQKKITSVVMRKGGKV